MKKPVFFIIASLILVAGLVAAGCTQTDSGASPSSGNPAPGSGEGSGNMAAGPAGGQNDGYPMDNPTGSSSRQFRGQEEFLNETRIGDAAAKLGVSADALHDALNSTADGRQDMDAAAQKLGVTREQLTGALGFPAGSEGAFNGTRMRNGGNTTAGQGPGGQPPG